MIVMPDPVSMSLTMGAPSILVSSQQDPHFSVNGSRLVQIIMLVPGRLLPFLSCILS